VRPLALLAGGIALVVLDFRTESLDLLPDPLGWALIAVAAGWLGLTAARRLAWVTAALSLSDLALPSHYVRIDPLTGERLGDSPADGRAASVRLEFLPVTAWRLAGMTAAVVLTGVTLWMILSPLARRARYEADPRSALRLRIAAGVVVAGWVVPWLATVAAAVVHDRGVYDPVWDDGLNYLGLVGLVAAGYAVWAVMRARDTSWAQRERGWVPSPWDVLRLERAAQKPWR
jgi:hypothetical protein